MMSLQANKRVWIVKHEWKSNEKKKGTICTAQTNKQGKYLQNISSIAKCPQSKPKHFCFWKLYDHVTQQAIGNCKMLTIKRIWKVQVQNNEVHRCSFPLINHIIPTLNKNSLQFFSSYAFLKQWHQDINCYAFFSRNLQLSPSSSCMHCTGHLLSAGAIMNKAWSRNLLINFSLFLLLVCLLGPLKDFRVRRQV